MQPSSGQQATPFSRDVLHSSPPAPSIDDEAPIQDEEAREHEEMRMLLLGFGTGILIAFVFLIYIVIAFAGVLP